MARRHDSHPVGPGCRDHSRRLGARSGSSAAIVRPASAAYFMMRKRTKGLMGTLAVIGDGSHGTADRPIRRLVCRTARHGDHAAVRQVHQQTLLDAGSSV